MDYSFYFESKFREWRKVNQLKFHIPDGTEFKLAEEWLIPEKRNSPPMQRMVFLKENNYNRKYQVTVEVSSSSNYTSGTIVVSKVTNAVRTSILILLSDFKKLRYPVSDKVTIGQTIVCERVIQDIFKYKVSITRIPQEENEIEKIPKRDRVFILSDQIHSLLETEQFFDVVITDGCSVIRAHRNILSARSIYFKCMFRYGWRENQQGIVHIQGTEIGIMKEMLHYIYSGVLRPMGFSTMYDLFQAADMYILSDLKQLLAEELRRRIGVENALGIFMLAHFAWDVNLKFDSLRFIINHFHEIELTETWKCVVNEIEFRPVVEAIKLFRTENRNWNSE